MINLGLCNKCRARVPAEFFEHDQQVWIRKTCPECGVTESLVSNDMAAWKAKRDLYSYVPNEPVACSLNCDGCHVDHKPNMVFLDVTNRCNMNCPICIATIRGMGFDFNPPLSYFEKIFAELGKMDPLPVVQLFGGEPTVREDLLEIIKIARKYRLAPHVTTNGIRLADENYCRKLCESRVAVRLGFDGVRPEIYQKMRNQPGACAKKLKAMENLRKYSRRKHTIIACAAKGINDQYMAEFLQYCHDNRDVVADVGLIPLTENWEEGTFHAVETTTMEDVEKMVQDNVAGGKVEFIPAGLAYAARKMRSFFRTNPRSETLLLAGVHPNCESMTWLVSNGKHFISFSHYLKKSFGQAFVEFAEISKKLDPKLDRLDNKKAFDRLRGRVRILLTYAPWTFKTLKLGALAWGALKYKLKGLQLKLTSKTASDGVTQKRRPRWITRVAMLPFEEQHSVDAARMESCKAVFAYEDTEDGKVKTIPACLWYPYRNDFLQKLSNKYGIAGKTSRAEAEAIA